MRSMKNADTIPLPLNHCYLDVAAAPVVSSSVVLPHCNSSRWNTHTDDYLDQSCLRIPSCTRCTCRSLWTLWMLRSRSPHLLKDINKGSQLETMITPLMGMEDKSFYLVWIKHDMTSTLLDFPTLASGPGRLSPHQGHMESLSEQYIYKNRVSLDAPGYPSWYHTPPGSPGWVPESKVKFKIW